MRIFAFDSGVGGLTAVAPLLKLNKRAEIFYLGDLANLPYGSKSPERLRQLVKANIAWMLSNLGKDQAPDLLVIACNTASAHCMPIVHELALKSSVPAFGVIESGCRAVLPVAPQRVVVVATSATVGIKTYSNNLRELGYTGEIIEKACPLFVPLVEEGMIDNPATEWIIRNYLDSVLQPQDTVILGCTHYPYLAPTLARLYPTVRWIDAGGALFRDAGLQKIVNDCDDLGQPSRLNLYFTDHSVTRARVEAFTRGLGIDAAACTLNPIDPII